MLIADGPCVYRAERPTEAGAEAPLAHQDVRQFPAWYKPYTFNYSGDGYLVGMFAGILLFGYSYTNDIKEQKGRKSRQVFLSPLQTNREKTASSYLARERLAAGDAEFEKFTHAKERAAVHHH